MLEPSSSDFGLGWGIWPQPKSTAHAITRTGYVSITTAYWLIDYFINYIHNNRIDSYQSQENWQVSRELKHPRNEEELLWPNRRGCLRWKGEYGRGSIYSPGALRVKRLVNQEIKVLRKRWEMVQNISPSWFKISQIKDPSTIHLIDFIEPLQ